VERKRYSRKFQRMAVARMETCEDVGELARELGVRPRCLYKWRRKLEMVEPGQEASRPSTHASAHRKEIHRLKQLLAEEDPGGGFFQRCLAKSRGSTPEERRNWREGIFEQIREVMLLQGSLSIEKCHMIPSMSRPAYDNASCESFIKTLKREEIYANKYTDLEDQLLLHKANVRRGCASFR
jgi:transposase-like protein